MKNSLVFAALLVTSVVTFAQPANPSTPANADHHGAGHGAKEDGHHKRHHGQHGHPDARKMSEHHVSSLDTDKDGKVSRQEFLARQSEAFSKADADSDGYVTVEELVARHEKHHADMAARRDARNKSGSTGATR